MSSRRWLGVDPGTVRIGLAVGGMDDRLASPLEVITVAGHGDPLKLILDAAGDWAVEGVVVGLPLNMDDTEGPMARQAREMAAELAHRSEGLDVRLWDERLSSFAADKLLAGHYTRKKRRARQDAIAAAQMLSDFLAGDGPETAERVG